MKLKSFPKSQRWDGFPMKSKKKKNENTCRAAEIIKDRNCCLCQMNME